jgi:CheY-like chemotaxis protein
MTHTTRCQNILIVEDDKDIRQALVDVLTLETFRVTTAGNGKEALELLRNSPNSWRPCFILLDLMMPIMNGWEFLLVQRSDPKLKDIPVMVCSAVADRTRFPGIVEFLKKPINIDELLTLVHRYCDPSLQLAHEEQQA